MVQQNYRKTQNSKEAPYPNNYKGSQNYLYTQRKDGMTNIIFIIEIVIV